MCICSNLLTITKYLLLDISLFYFLHLHIFLYDKIIDVQKPHQYSVKCIDDNRYQYSAKYINHKEHQYSAK